MKRIVQYVETQRSTFGLAPDSPLHVELRAPWRVSYIGRAHYVVHQGGMPELFIKHHSPLCGSIKAAPEYFPIAAEALLPRLCGSFELDGAWYSWAKRADGLSLQDTIRDMLNPVALESLLLTTKSILDAQVASATVAMFHAQDFLAYAASHMQAEAHSLLHHTLQKMNVQDLPALPCSWGHGDVWAKDIFLREKTCTLVDWEWATDNAPLGADIVDLYVTTAEHVLGASPLQAWQSLRQSPIPLLRGVRGLLFSVWQQYGMMPEQQIAVCQYALWRAAVRVIAQERYRGQGFLAIFEQSMRIISG